MTEASKPKRVRSATESLLSIALALEAVLIFFVTMTVFGLKVLPPVAAFVGGAVFVVLLVAAARVVRYRWGIWFGWALQLALLATGFVMPAMFFVAAVFVAIWVYCLVKGTQLDARKTNPFSGQDPIKENE
jgi:hypothetical protein